MCAEWVLLYGGMGSTCLGAVENEILMLVSDSVRLWELVAATVYQSYTIWPAYAAQLIYQQMKRSKIFLRLS